MLKTIWDLVRWVLMYGTVLAIFLMAVVLMVVRTDDRALLFMIILIVTYCISFFTAGFGIFIEKLKLKFAYNFLLFIPVSVVGTVSGVYLARFIIGRLFFNVQIFSGVRDLPPYIIGCLIITGFITLFEHLNSARKEKQQQLAKEKQRVNELEIRGRDATIQALRSRLNPHFLFNTLNFISELIHQNPEKAEKAVVNLSEIYRKTLDMSEKNRIPLLHEIELMKKYLENERMRYGDRLNYQMDIDTDCLDVLIPALILQPFVENAITKGIARKKDGGEVSISVKRRDGGMVFAIEDTGAGCKTFQPGFGIENVIRRMELLYQDKYRFEFNSEKGRGSKVYLFIPEGG